MMYIVVCLEELQDVRSSTNVDLKHRNAHCKPRCASSQTKIKQYFANYSF